MNSRAAPTPGHALSQVSTQQLALAVGGFIVCFATTGSLAGMMPLVAARLKLSEVQVGLALAAPVLIGSMGRIPTGILADRFGGRAVYIAVMSGAICSALLMATAHSYAQLLTYALTLGIPLAVFPVGTSFVNGWFPPHNKGAALGVLGLGNVGHSLSLAGAPLLAAHFGYQWGFWGFSLLTCLFLSFFVATAQNAPSPNEPYRSNVQSIRSSFTHPMSWVLALFYFLTFGGMLAMSAYLPKFLTLRFHLSGADAGFRAAGFVLLATIGRPIGGFLADRIGGRTVLLGVFPFTASMALVMAFPSIEFFTAGALGMAAAIGLGNGAIFKLVPQYFPRSVGSVTGFVGAAGALGGFFPPLILGVLWQVTGSFFLGFILLSISAMFCFVTSWRQAA